MDAQVPTIPIHSPDSLAKPDPALQDTPKDNHWITILAMGLFVVGSLAVIAFLYYQNQQLKGMLANYQAPIASPIPSATPDITANWKTYTDPKFNYSFKYSDTWIDQTGINDKNLGNFSLKSNEEEWITGTVFTGTPDLENDKKNSGSSRSFILNKQKYLFVVYAECMGPECGVSKKYLDVFDQILSTFKFTETSPSSSPSASPTSY